MMSPRPKSLKLVFRQVTSAAAVLSPQHLISKTPHVLTNLCFFISLNLTSCVSPPPPCKFLHCQSANLIFFLFLLPPLPILLHKTVHSPSFFHACFSKTVFILFCGLWRIRSQAIGKVSDGCAMPTLCLAAHALDTDVPRFFLPLRLLVSVERSVSVCDISMFALPQCLCSPMDIFYSPAMRFSPFI